MLCNLFIYCWIVRSFMSEPSNFVQRPSQAQPRTLILFHSFLSVHPKPIFIKLGILQCRANPKSGKLQQHLKTQFPTRWGVGRGNLRIGKLKLYILSIFMQFGHMVVKLKGCPTFLCLITSTKVPLYTTIWLYLDNLNGKSKLPLQLVSFRDL